MKKSFPLHQEGKADARVLDAIKADVRRYVKRERGKQLPDGFALWRFDCKVGATAADAEVKDLKDVSAAIDAIAATGAALVYVEILAVADHHPTGGGRLGMVQ
jgi:hypothetical protein